MIKNLGRGLLGAIGGASPSGRAVISQSAAAIDNLSSAGRPVLANHSEMVEFIRDRASSQLVSKGKKMTSYGIIGASAASMMSTKRSTGAYNPAPAPMTSTPMGTGRAA